MRGQDAVSSSELEAVPDVEALPAGCIFSLCNLCNSHLQMPMTPSFIAFETPLELVRMLESCDLLLCLTHSARNDRHFSRSIWSGMLDWEGSVSHHAIAYHELNTDAWAYKRNMCWEKV